MTTAAPLSWIKQAREGTACCQKIPLWGSCPPFPWDKLSENLKKELSIEDFQLSFSGSGLLEPEKFTAPFGSNPKLTFMQLSPLPGYLTWILSTESMQEITSLLLSQEGTKGISDSRIQEGFYEFLLLETAREIENIQIYPDLHLLFLEEKRLSDTSCLGIDLSVTIKGRSFPSRLLLSPECSAAFEGHFSKKTFDCTTSPSFSKIDIPLALEVGSCLLEQSDWAGIKKGDFLILDRCSYDPQTDKGTAMLSLAEKPCFIVKIKKTGLKILDYAVYHGDLHTMNEKFISDSLEEETPLPAPVKPNGKEKGEALDDETETTSETPLEAPSEVHEETKPAEEEGEEEEVEIPTTAVPPEVLTSPGKIPFPIVVEIGRIQMSLEKLLQLTPGNILEMHVRPSEGVYLTVHGKKIARGELIKIGEVLGVKILETGDGPA